MGLRKDLHIFELTKVPEIRERWKTVYGKYPDQSDVDDIFKILSQCNLPILGSIPLSSPTSQR